jgi:hypothetical protein
MNLRKQGSEDFNAYPRGSRTVGPPSPPPPGCFGPLRGGGAVCVSDIFILNEVWAQHETHNHFAWFITYRHWLQTISRTFYRRPELIKACYSLPELYVKCVYLKV